MTNNPQKWMNSLNFCLAYSSEPKVSDPLAHIIEKRPVYNLLLDMALAKGWRVYVVTRKTYIGANCFAGAWKYLGAGKFSWDGTDIRSDVVYDRTGGVKFPPDDPSLKVVNTAAFKKLCWDKWATYQVIGEYMPQTVRIADVGKIKTDWVVLKPYNGLKGIGIYVGPKDGWANFNFRGKKEDYIAQEFIDTKTGIPGLTPGRHDLRVVVVNNKIVWSHIRTPKEGTYTANVALGGVLTEINPDKIPDKVIAVAHKIMALFFEKYGNQIYSLDFGLQDGLPYIYEINDTIGFPKWEMANRDHFLEELLLNFNSCASGL